MKTINAKFTNKKLSLTHSDILTLLEHGELSYASVESIFERSKISFDDIEAINKETKNFVWGSDADRKYRKSAIKKAILKFAANPFEYIQKNDIVLNKIDFKDLKMVESCCNTPLRPIYTYGYYLCLSCCNTYPINN